MSSPAPFFSIVTPVYDPDVDLLRQTIRSVTEQKLQDWELILVDDRSRDERVREVLRAAAAADPRVRVIERETNGHIVAASNDGVAAARGEFIALLDHDDLLVPRALRAMKAAIDAEPEADYLYSDEDKIDEQGRKYDPFRKPPWSPERLRGQMYTSHLSVLRTALVREVGGFHEGFDVPWWVVLLSAGALSGGTWTGGWRIMRTLGRRIIDLDPPRGFAAEVTASAVLYTTAFVFAAPISTTQTITSAILGVGATRRLTAVRWGVAGNIAVAWVLTIPAAALSAAAAYGLLVLVVGLLPQPVVGRAPEDDRVGVDRSVRPVRRTERGARHVERGEGPPPAEALADLRRGRRHERPRADEVDADPAAFGLGAGVVEDRHGGQPGVPRTAEVDQQVADGHLPAVVQVEAGLAPAQQPCGRGVVQFACEGHRGHGRAVRGGGMAELVQRHRCPSSAVRPLIKPLWWRAYPGRKPGNRQA